ncbi:MAG: hypothetical protein ACR2K3_07605 [Nocardioides sp.]
MVDEYVEDGRSAIYVGQNVVALSELSTFALGVIADGWADVDAVASALVEEFGPPPGDRDGVITTTAVLTQLSQQGLLELV